MRPWLVKKMVQGLALCLAGMALVGCVQTRALLDVESVAVQEAHIYDIEKRQYVGPIALTNLEQRHYPAEIGLYLPLDDHYDKLLYTPGDKEMYSLITGKSHPVPATFTHARVRVEHIRLTRNPLRYALVPVTMLWDMGGFIGTFGMYVVGDAQ